MRLPLHNVISTRASGYAASQSTMSAQPNGAANVVGHAPLSRVASIVEAVDPVPLLVGASAAFGATYLDGVAALRCE